MCALQSVFFEVPRGQFCSIVGKSGCGKSTLMRIICGLLRPTAGRVVLDGREVVRPSHDLAVVFQDYSRSLLPWKTVEENVQLGLWNRGVSRSATSYLELVGLGRFQKSYPWQLSGGMQQRVAIARALAREPKLLLLDEAFGALDAPTRFELEDEVLSLAKEFGITVLMITHGIDEAVYMSDRVLVMQDMGRLDIRPEFVAEGTDIEVALPRPRDQILTRAEPRFTHCREIVFRKLGLRHDPEAAPVMVSA